MSPHLTGVHVYHHLNFLAITNSAAVNIPVHGSSHISMSLSYRLAVELLGQRICAFFFILRPFLNYTIKHKYRKPNKTNSELNGLLEGKYPFNRHPDQEIEALLLFCGDHNCLPSPESNH